MPRTRNFTKKQLLNQATACKKRIAAERDLLRRIVDDLEEIHDDLDRAVDEMQSAIDTISQHV